MFIKYNYWVWKNIYIYAYLKSIQVRFYTYK